MKKILIINGHEYWETSKGQLNKHLTQVTSKFFQELGLEIKSTFINESFDLEEEVNKYLWANVVIYFTPVYWFDVPAAFKNYLEKVFSGGKTRLFMHDGRPDGGSYGTGGLLNTTRYMLCTTWNAPEDAFNNPTSSFLFENKTVDDVFLHFHSAQKFLGMKKVPGIHFYDVKRNPKIEVFTQQLLHHLEFNFNFK
jgi:modulator of drug activity B